MDEIEIKALHDNVQSTLSDFQELHKKELEEVKKNGSAEALTKMATDAANEAVSVCTDKIEELKASINAPANNEQKSDDAVREHKEAFISYIRKGNETGLKDLERKALSVGTDTEGGFVITNTMEGIINGIAVETSPMATIASVANISTNALELPIKVSRVGTSDRSEKGAVSETAAFTLALKTIGTHEIYAEPAVTQTMIDDAQFNIEQYLAGEIADELNFKKNLGYITGDGVAGARGFLHDVTASPSEGSNSVQYIASGSAGTFDGDDIIDLYYSLKGAYTANAKFVMSRGSEKILRKLKEDGEYIYSFDKIGNIGSALGVPIVRFDDMPDPATDSFSIAVGDFSKGYQVVNRMGTRVVRDSLTSKGFVKLYTTQRYGGDVKIAEAIKVLKLGTS